MPAVWRPVGPKVPEAPTILQTNAAALRRIHASLRAVARSGLTTRIRPIGRSSREKAEAAERRGADRRSTAIRLRACRPGARLGGDDDGPVRPPGRRQSVAGCAGGPGASLLAKDHLPSNLRTEVASELGAACRNRTDDLRITRVSQCVARGFKVRASFMFAGCYWWRSLAVDGGSGASRGHAPEVRRPSSRWGAAVERPHTTVTPSCPWNLPRDRPHRAGNGPVPWPGSLPGPWLLARVLPEARCHGWPKAISEGNAKRP